MYLLILHDSVSINNISIKDHFLALKLNQKIAARIKNFNL